MLQTFRALAAVLLGLLASVALGVLSALTAAVTLAATALLVPGTGTPNANVVAGYMQNARDYYLTDTPCVKDNCTLRGINYPASFWPVSLPGWCEPGRCYK